MDLNTAAGIVVVNGKIILTWGEIEKKMWVHSCRKSFLNALFGIAIEEGKIDTSQTLEQLNIDDIAPSLSTSEKRATILDLMKARSGVYHKAADEVPAMIRKRPLRDQFPPGEHWYYNNWDFNVLGHIYEQKTNEKIFESFYRRIALPLAMDDYMPADGKYDFEFEKSKFPSYKFKMSTRDMARFGLLFLRKGSWQGTQVLSPEWIQASTQKYSEASPPIGVGYGLLWWVDRLFPEIDLGPDSFAAKGYGGHYILVIPRYDMVIVTRADDQWFKQDPERRAIGPYKEGALVAKILAAKL